MHQIKSLPQDIDTEFNSESPNIDLKLRKKVSPIDHLNNNQHGFTLVEFTMSLFLLTIVMLGLARWQHQTVLKHHWLSHQLHAWMVAEQVIEQLAAGQTVNKQIAPNFKINYNIDWQGRCRLIKVQIDGRQQSKARLKLVVC